MELKITRTQYITRTAILLALALLFQMLRMFFPGIPPQASQYLVGTMINVCLFIAVMNVGFLSGLVISVLTPVVASLQGFLPLVVLIPFVAAGNTLLVAVQYLLFRALKRKRWSYFVAAVCAAAVKFGFLFLTVSLGAESMLKIHSAAAAVLSVSFSYPQIITAVLALVVAFPVIFALQRIDNA